MCVHPARSSSGNQVWGSAVIHHRALQMLHGLYTLEWVGVRESRTAPRILAALADDRRLVRAPSVRSAHRYLTSRGLIEPEGHLIDPLFRAWLQQTL